MSTRFSLAFAFAFAFAFALAACGSDSKKAEDTLAPEISADISADGAAQPDTTVDPDVVQPDDVPVPEETTEGDVVEHNDTSDIAPDIEEGLPPLPTKDPLPTPADPLEGSEVESCALYQEERCQDGVKQQCAIYDAGEGSWVEDPDPLLERAYLYDRWRDLYNSPDGQAVDRDFNKEILPLTPESEWGKPEHLEQYWGSGDGGIWTGWSTVASILRYAQTGTEADYQRMEQQVRDMVSMYEVTGIPGYVVRYHFLLLPEGAPNHPDHILRWENSFNPGHHDRLVVNPEELDNMPAIYTEGITDSEGKVWKGTPMWHGRPSIDQNTGPMTSLPLAWSLLKDEELKGKITHNLTCYLKRLQRIELINLQDNPELIEGLLAYFNVGELKFDPEDMDLSKLEKIVGYVHRQVNTKNEETFDMGCPDTVQYEPWRVIDATADTFFLDMLALISDMDTDDERENQLDHYYFPAIRGGDAMHLMHLATMAYYFTGDEMYREFLYEELVGNINTIGVMHTAGAFDLPKYCKKYFGDQITFGPWWTFLQLLGESDLRSEVAGAYHTEMWDKLVKQVDNVDFNIMYAGELSDEEAPDKEQALASAMEGLQWMGGNGGVLMGSPEDPKWLQDPRRSYTATPEEILAATPDGVVAECATQQELDICTVEIEFMGITLPNLTGWHTWDCTGNEYECEAGEGQCYEMHASAPLPIHLREYTDYLWQRNAFELGKNAGIEGKRQYAGSDYSVPFWNALRYGFITEGKGQVLGWKDAGVCE